MKQTTDKAVAKLFSEGLKSGHLTREFVDKVVSELMDLSQGFWMDAECEVNTSSHNRSVILRGRSHLANDIADMIDEEIGK